VVSSPVSGWCELCEKLNDRQQKPKVYKDMTDWWFHKDIPCLYGDDYLDQFETRPEIKDATDAILIGK
jgi:alpha-1,3-fucosyltransferase